MRESPEPRSSVPEVQTPRSPNRTAKPTPSQPLYLRLYFYKHLIDLVRLVGYDGLPLEGFRERVQPLVEAHGEDAIRGACEEILHVDETRTPLCARLTDHARTLAVGILGRPDRAGPQALPTVAPETDSSSTDATPGSHDPRTTEAPTESPSEPKQRDRKKGAPAPKVSAVGKAVPHGAKPKTPTTAKKGPPAKKPATKGRR